jgi:hypothetical protein
MSLLLQACSQSPIPGSSQDDSSLNPLPSSTAVTDQSVSVSPAEHRIGIRSGESGIELYDRITGERFVPRGVNYHRWESRSSPGSGTIPIDSLFNTAFGQLDQADADLQQIAALGFNTVRVWRNACWGSVGGCIGNPGGGLSDSYLDNITEFLHMAKRHGIYVIFTDDWVPEDGGYSQELNKDCCSQFDGFNLIYLANSGVSAERLYWEDFIAGLIERKAPLDFVLAYSLKNEAFYEAQLPPLNLTSGMVTAANGNSYDMGDQGERRRMMEDGWLFWSQQLRNAILALDPTALVTMGFFVQQEPNPVRQGDTRLVYLERMLLESQLDFFDFHAYPEYDLSIQEHVENFAMTELGDKLIIMGEFGADKRNYRSPERAAAALQSWQVDSCNYGFDGWLLWTWGENPGSEFWNALDGDGKIGTTLASIYRPDPCVYGDFDFIRFNAASLAEITASSAVDGFPPELVADGTVRHWNAAAKAPQWVELSLPSPVDVTAIELAVAQDPPGRSIHEIWVKKSGEDFMLVHTFDGVTSEGDVLIFQPEEPLIGIEIVKVVTTSILDLWPAWHEIEILTMTPPG